jgi:hypothetical protein
MIVEYLSTDEDAEFCCAKLFRSELFIQNADKVRYELISIANEVHPRTYLLIKGIDE